MAKPELVTVTAGGYAMRARFEWTLAPATLLPPSASCCPIASK